LLFIKYGLKKPQNHINDFLKITDKFTQYIALRHHKKALFYLFIVRFLGNKKGQKGVK